MRREWRIGTLPPPRPVCAPGRWRKKSRPAGSHRPAVVSRPSWRARGSCLLEMIRDELRHLEHRYLLLSPEHCAEFLVGIDKAPIDVVLQLVLLDVIPDLLGDIGARHRHRADNGSERSRRGHRLPECRIRLAPPGGFR